MIGLNKIGLNQVQLNRLYLNAPFPVYRKMTGGGSSDDGFPVLPGDVTRWHFGGLTNEMMAAMDDPRIEDADGKGRFLSFKNFLWAGMSGVNGYVENFNEFRNNFPTEQLTIDEHNSSLIKISVLVPGINNSIYIPKTKYQFGKSYYLRISSEGYNEGDLSLLFYATSVSTATSIRIPLNPNGITEIPAVQEDDYQAVYITVSGKIGSFTIEQLPLYPGFILGDGVDDFAVTEKELNFQDTYTVYTAFIPFQNDPARNMILCGKNETKDFSINYSGMHLNFKPSTGVNLAPRINQFMLLVCKRNKDITTIINLSTGESNSHKSVEFISNPGLYYLWRNVFATFYAEAAIAGQVICNGHFTTDEEDEKVLNWHKKQYTWLFPDQVWTVVGKANKDTDRDTIPNITGNGNNLVLSNFGFAENSGYGLYAYNFNSFTLKDNEVKPTDVKNDSFRIVGTGNGSNVSVLSNTSNSANWKIRVTGMKEGDNLIVGNANKSGDYFTITKDGIYTFQKQYEASSTNGVWYNSAQETDVLVEQIPEYEGYLVTDGVDDKIQSSVFTVGKDWTTVGEWEFLKEDAIKIAGIAKLSSFRFYNYSLTGRMNVYINAELGTNVVGNSIKAVTSKGSVYLDFNSLQKVTPGDTVDFGQMLMIGYNGTNYTKMAFKNFAIYPTVLSKEDCIKAYNYLQTLKAKI